MRIQQQGGGISIALGRLGNILRRLHPHGFPIGLAKLAAKFGRFVAVELQNINRHCAQNPANLLGRFVHKQRHFSHLRRQCGNNFSGLRSIYATFAFGIKHQADRIRTQFGSGLRVSRPGEAADFDFRHRISFQL